VLKRRCFPTNIALKETKVEIKVKLSEIPYAFKRKDAKKPQVTLKFKLMKHI
jgi:hypothetical protein